MGCLLLAGDGWEGVAGGPGPAQGTAAAGLHSGSWGASGWARPAPLRTQQKRPGLAQPQGLRGLSLDALPLGSRWAPGHTSLPKTGLCLCLADASPALWPAPIQLHLPCGPSLSSPPRVPPERPEAAFCPDTKLPSGSPGPLSAAPPPPQPQAQHSPRVLQQEPGHSPRTRADGGDACRETPGHPGPALATWTSPMGTHTGAFVSSLPAGTRAF